MPTIYVLSGPDVGASAELVEGSVLGRATEAHLRLRDRSISRKHARLELRQGVWTVADLNSRNGLFNADGDRVRDLALEDGLEFRIGEVELRARVEEAAQSAAVFKEPSASRAQTTAPVEDEIELDEIDLEDPDEIDLGEAAAKPAAARVNAPPGAPRGMRGAREATPPPSKKKKAVAPAGGFGGNDLERTTLTGRAAARAGVNVATPARTDILQYSQQAQRGGLLASDLEQQPLWKRILLVLVALLIAGGLAFGIWRAALLLKSRNAPPVGDGYYDLEGEFGEESDGDPSDE